MKIAVSIATSILALVVSYPASGIDLKDYRELRNFDAGRWETYLFGVANGYFWANGAQVYKELPPIYCQPNNLAVSSKMAVSLFDLELETGQVLSTGDVKPYADDTQVEMIMLKALSNRFPC